ncbi:hypothetical protein TYRP_015301 [Tyrophagus putrescentiae]|nr:hypothetical protein TYRP_015301 [Tyrophagus putrescentiae]
MKSLAYFTFVTRYLVISLCLHYDDLAAYFTSVDVIAGQLMYRSAVHRRSNYYLMHTLEAAFAARLIALNLFSENSKNGRIVWSHLYDLLVRNSQKEKRQKSKEGKNHLTFTSPLLHHYRQLSFSTRRKCRLITATFETLFSVLFAFYLLLLSHTLLQTAISAGLNTLLQLLFLLTAVAPVNITCALFGLLHILLTATALLLVATAHSAEYRTVNGALTKGITKTLKSFNSRNHKSNHNRLETTLNLVCATKKFRTCHAYLTTFLLRYNSAIISRVITAYLHLVLPVHAYREVFFYFQQQSYVPFSYRLNKTLYQAVSWAFLGTLTALLAQLNAKIGHAGQSGLLAAVFARKGKLDFEAELGGEFHKESLSFPETLAVSYSSFVLFFGGKFISKH